MAERIVEANGVELCTEAFGDPADPPILLVMGIGASMLWWEEGFCRLLADGGRFVIRYDHRDTGRSVTYEPGRPGYSGADLVADAAGVLDAYGIPAAHVVGVSAGGAFAQLLALDFPDRVALARPHQHLSRAARRPRAPAADRRVRPVRVDRRGRLVGRRVGRSSTSSATRACSPEGSGRSTRRATRASCGATSSAPATSRPLQNHDVAARRRGPERDPVLDHRADTGHPRHRRPDVPARARRGAGRGDPRREAAAARGRRPRRRSSRLGDDRRRDPRAHRRRLLEPADPQARPAGTVASSHSSKVGPASLASGPGRAAPFA